jgi:hypothetical protein
VFRVSFIDTDLGGVGVEGVVNELPEKLDALRVESLPDRDDMPLVNGHLELLFLFDFHGQ